MKFLKLTNTFGNKVRINFEHVESYGEIISDGKRRIFAEEFKGKTFILPCCGSEEHPYIVEETPAEIDRMLIES